MVVVLGAALNNGWGNAQLRCPMDSRDGNLATQFVVKGGSVKMPVGAFLLIRKDGKIGAIRLTNVDPVSTELEGKSSYESYFQGDGSGSLTTANALKQTGQLDLKPLKGIGRLAFQTGQNKGRVGKWSFAFATPTAIHMWPFRGDLHDYGYEFAPTSACDLSEIDVHDNRLRWFRFDLYAHVILPLADLPK